MIGDIQRDTSLFFGSLVVQLELPEDPQLRQIDAILDDPSVLAWAEQALGSRAPKSKTTGRKAMAADRALRSCALKHIKGWSYRQLEKELTHNIAYRQFTRFDGDKIPTYSTFARTFATFGDDFTRKMHLAVVQQSTEQRIATGRRLRVDSSAVETNVHHPTDSTLLSDGIRVVTRVIKRISNHCEAGAVAVVDHARATKHRLLEIHRAAKVQNEQGTAKLQSSYGKLVSVAQALVNRGAKVVDEVQRHLLPIIGNPLVVEAYGAELEQVLPLVQRVIDQTKARVFEGNPRFPNKVLSIFEPETCVIRKGKAHKPTESAALFASTRSKMGS